MREIGNKCFLVSMIHINNNKGTLYEKVEDLTQNGNTFHKLLLATVILHRLYYTIRKSRTFKFISVCLVRSFLNSCVSVSLRSYLDQTKT